jgi:hypothetical protein
MLGNSNTDDASDKRKTGVLVQAIKNPLRFTEAGLKLNSLR